MWSSLMNRLLTMWVIVAVQLLRCSNAAVEMDNEFAEFEDMEVENISDQQVVLNPHREANKATGEKSAATVISLFIY